MSRLPNRLASLFFFLGGLAEEESGLGAAETPVTPRSAAAGVAGAATGAASGAASAAAAAEEEEDDDEEVDGVGAPRSRVAFCSAFLLLVLMPVCSALLFDCRSAKEPEFLLFSGVKPGCQTPLPRPCPTTRPVLTPNTSLTWRQVSFGAK